MGPTGVTFLMQLAFQGWQTVRNQVLGDDGGLEDSGEELLGCLFRWGGLGVPVPGG